VQLSKHITHKVFHVIAEQAEILGVEAYVIGGFVRDILLKRPNQDIDIVTNNSGIELAEACAKALKVKRVAIYKNFGTAHFKYGMLDLEFVGARKESYTHHSRKPQIEPGSLADDQLRRDFTINALAISLRRENFGELIDPFNGLDDLDKQILKTPQLPDLTYSDDPLRMLRAIRFVNQLGFYIDAESYQAIKRNADRIKIISAERITTELNKILLCDQPSIGLKLLFETGLLQHFFPEMVRLYGVEKRNGLAHKDNFYHTLQVVDNLAKTNKNLWLRWGALLHDIAKPPTKRFEEGTGWTFHGHEELGARMVPKIFARLKLPLDHNMKFVQKMVQLHLRPIALTKEEI